MPPPWVDALLRVMDEAVFVIDTAGKVRHANAAASRLTGRDSNGLIAVPVGDVLQGSDNVLAELDVGTPQRTDLTAITLDGHQVPVEAIFTRLEEEPLALCVVTDASLQVHLERELRVARQAARAAARERTMFLATMSHEIRTPLNGVLGMAGLLAESNLNLDQRAMVGAVAASGANLLDLVNDILDFTRIDSGHVELEVVPFDLGESIAELMNTYSSAAAAKKIDLVVDVDPALPPRLYGDSGRIRQVLGNLLNNAIKFTDRGYVVVSIEVLRADDLDVVLEFGVTDTGVGIADELRETLFRPFVQADLTTSRRHGGSGLGLAIARRIIRLMGGELELQSTPGQGSKFTFRVDLRRAKPVVPAVGPLDLTGMRVLVVSDIAARRVALARVLQAWSGTVASCGADAATHRLLAGARRASPYDLVIVDEPVVSETPLKAADEIAGLELSTRPTMALLVAAEARAPAIALATRGIAATIVKPVNWSELRRVAQLLLQPTAAVDAPTRDAHSIPRLRGEGVRVLVAEDNPINQKVALGYLDAMGLQADAVGNGLEAVEAVRRIDYTLVLMDLHMPEIDGLSATAQIRRSERGAQLPIIGLTADVRAEARARTEAVGMDAFIAKPVTPHKLAEVLSRWIEPMSDGAGPLAETVVLPANAGANAGAVLDTAALRRLRSLERVGSQTGLVDSLVGMFLDKTPARLERIVRACEAAQHGFVEIEAHSLKSSCRNLGAERMGACAAELERRAQAGDVDKTTVDRLAREFQTVASILRRL